MKVILSREKDFIPKWNDNQESDEPVKFIIRAMTTSERDECTDIVFDHEGQENLKPDFKKYFRKGVKRIENLFVDGKPITKAVEILELPGLYDLYLEVASEIAIYTGRDNLKN